ncbi:hypothetical protein BGZ76_004485, partial [Entomortierella beljakovae]
MTPSQISLHVYTDFDSTVVLQDTGNHLLAYEMGQEELDRIDHLPETQAGQISLRKAEDMKWERIRLSIQEAADIVIDPRVNVSSNQQSNGSGSRGSSTSTSSSSHSRNKAPFDPEERSYYVQLDPGFKQFHSYCQENNIPITIVSIGIQPLIEEMLNRYLGEGHGITVCANGLTFKEDGSWRVLWRDSSPFGVDKGRAMREARINDLKNPSTDKILWCGDGSSDFPAALASDIVLARKNTSLEKLLRANHIPHKVFTTFDTVTETAREWIQKNPKT